MDAQSSTFEQTAIYSYSGFSLSAGSERLSRVRRWIYESTYLFRYRRSADSQKRLWKDFGVIVDATQANGWRV